MHPESNSLIEKISSTPIVEDFYVVFEKNKLTSVIIQWF
jgi:hypothetical protein